MLWTHPESTQTKFAHIRCSGNSIAELFTKQSLTILIWTAMYAVVYFVFMDKPYGILQMCTLFSLPILRMYNGERGKWKGMKWFFYIYYPAHLFAIGLVRMVLGSGSIFP